MGRRKKYFGFSYPKEDDIHEEVHKEKKEYSGYKGYSGYGGYGGYGGYSSYGSYGSYYDSESFNYSKWITPYTPEDYPEHTLATERPDKYEIPSRNEIFKRLSQKGIFSSTKNETFVVDCSRYVYNSVVGKTRIFKTCYSDDRQLKMQTILTEEYPKYASRLVGSPLNRATDFLKFILDSDIATGEGMSVVDKVDKSTISRLGEIYRDTDIQELVGERVYPATWDSKVFTNLSLIDSFGEEFSVDKQVKDEITANSEVTKAMRIREYSQLSMLKMYQTLLPHYKAKLYAKDLIIDAKLKRTEVKQKIIILLDFSGSMKDPGKQPWVAAIMINRLKEVMAGKAEIYFSYFLSKKTFLNFHHCYDKESALKLWKKFDFKPSGGTTLVGDMVSYIHSELEYKRLHNIPKVDFEDRAPEILVINDGNDSIKSNEFPHKTNAVTIHVNNKELEDLCKKTSGKYIHIDVEGKVHR